jgi:hypothetical protein
MPALSRGSKVNIYYIIDNNNTHLSRGSKEERIRVPAKVRRYLKGAMELAEIINKSGVIKELIIIKVVP